MVDVDISLPSESDEIIELLENLETSNEAEQTSGQTNTEENEISRVKRKKTIKNIGKYEETRVENFIKDGIKNDILPSCHKDADMNFTPFSRCNLFFNRSKNSPIHIVFKANDFSSEYFCDFSDTTNDLYKSILGNNDEGLLIYEDMKLPKCLSLEEAGFFEGINYVTADNVDLSLCKRKDFEIVINYCNGKSVCKKIEEDETVKTICPDDKFVIIKNGTVLDKSIRIHDIFDNSDTCDYVPLDLLS